MTPLFASGSLAGGGIDAPVGSPDSEGSAQADDAGRHPSGSRRSLPAMDQLDLQQTGDSNRLRVRQHTAQVEVIYTNSRARPSASRVPESDLRLGHGP